MVTHARALRRAGLAIVCLWACWGIPVRAQETPAAPAPAAPAQPPVPSSLQQEIVSVQGFGDHNADCLSWTDGCVICARATEGKVNCSTPGIACLPGPTTCKVTKPK